MKNQIFLCGLRSRFLACSVLVLTVLVALPVRAAMLLRYTFDEASSGAAAAVDTGTGVAANGTFFGSATRITGSPGAFSTAALSVNGASGSTHYVSGGDADKLDGLSTVTMTMWLNLQGNPQGADRLLSKMTPSPFTGFDLRLAGNTGSAISATNVGLVFSICNSQSSGPPAATSTTNFNPSNVWTFVAVTYDGSYVRFYTGSVAGAVAQLGSSVSKPTGFGTPANSTADFRVGSTAATANDRTPPAFLDDVRIYDGVLSLAELETIRTENIPAAPLITQSPQNVTVSLGDPATMTVGAGGSAPLSYQWYFNSNIVALATNSSLILNSASTTNSGAYHVIVTNLYGAATSAVAWLNVLTIAPPTLLRAASSPTRCSVLLTFDRPLADAATNLGHFALSGSPGPSPSLLSASLDGTYSNLTLLTGRQEPNTSYVLTVSGVPDRATVTPMAAPTNVSLLTSPIYGPLNNVADAANWTLLWTAGISDAGNLHTNTVFYSIDHRLWATNFSRVAYYLEIQPSNAPLQYVWTAMDAFSADAMKVSIPVASSGALFQQPVMNLDVQTSVPGLAVGNALTGGYITFAPGDESNPGATGRGLMMISNTVAGQLIFAFNGWGSGGRADLGIGSVTSSNSATYTVKRIMAFVLPRTNAPASADVVVYGGTSGGVIAAVQASRMGKRAILLSPDNHLGGLSSGGLGWTDIGGNGNTYVGGIAREFYERNGARYGRSIEFNLEPHVAEQIFGEMLVEAGVTVVFNQRIASVSMSGQRITQVTMTDGSAYSGQMFIDTTYEGDLMALAGVTFTVGREGTNSYNESLAGITATGGSSYLIDPYIVPGDTNSGLIPFVSAEIPGQRGDSDWRVQTYNYRMCFTQSATNFLPITASTNYSDANCELFARYLDSVAKTNVALGALFTLGRGDVTGTGKYDINNQGEVSTDVINASWTWPTNTYAGRAALAKFHEDYTRAYFIYLAAGARSPSNIRTAMQTWGLAKDEFLDTAGWPHALYVREARRMVSDYVVIQQNCLGSRIAPESIGMGAYTIDSHSVQRFASGSVTLHEGGLGTSTPAPFPISYRSLIPRVGECENLFCTFALSASHVAYASCRMEPVFMILSQSAATAAAFAIDDHVSVQSVDYAKLALQLRVDRQVLTSGSSNSDGIIVDNDDFTGVVITGGWTNSAAIPGYWGNDYATDGSTEKGLKSVTYTPVLPTNGYYEVYLRWTAGANRASNVPVDIVYPDGTNTVMVNQQANNGAWVLLFATNFLAGTNAHVVIRTDGTAGFYVVADAVRFASTNLPPASVQVIASDAMAAELGSDPGRFSFVRSGDTNAALTLVYALSGTASNGVDYVTSLATITLPPGVVTANVIITPLLDALAEGDETVIFTLLPGTNYSVGPLSSATVVIHDSSAPNPVNMLPLIRAGGTVSIGFGGAAGITYGVQRATDVSGPWTTLTNIVAGPGLMQWEDRDPPAGQGFYRIVR